MIEHSETKPLNKDEQELLQKQIETDHNFYSVKWERDGSFKGIMIKKAKIVDKLLERNFFRFDIDTEVSRFIQVNNNMVKEVSKETITDIFMDFVENIQPMAHKTKMKNEDGYEASTDFYITGEMIRHAIFEKISEYFSKVVLFRLVSPVKIEIKHDTRYEKFLYYKNGFVRITKDGYELLDYSKLDKFIWVNQRIDRDFIPTPKKGMYEKFIERICGHKLDDEKLHANTEYRKKCFKTITGYLLHGFFDYSLKAVIMTDSKISLDDEPNGRTGKTLQAKALGKVLNYNKDSSVFAELNGKDFSAKNEFKYQSLNMETQLVAINDVPRNLQIEDFFNDITEGILVNKKNMNPYQIRAKMLILTNKTIQVNGESAKDRVIQFEFSDYYNSERSPFKEFNCWFFSEDWGPDEWNAFDSFMVSCCVDFFKFGLLEPDSINLHRRTLIDHTSHEFVDFMDEFIEAGTVKFYDEIAGQRVEGNINLQYGERLNKADLYTAFLNAFPNDYDQKKFKQRSFTKWLRMYTKHSPLFKEITKENQLEGRANGMDWIIFEKLKKD